MKHLFNDISYQERKKILEQHQGGMHIDNKKYHRLLTEKLGNVKPLVNEQEANKFLEDNYIPNVTKEGYKQVNKISLPDGEYKKQGSGYRVDLYDKDGKTSTGYVIITNSGIRGAWNNEPINVANGTIEDAYKMFFKDLGYKPTPQGQGGQQDVKTLTNKVASEGLKNVIPQMISSPPFKGTYSGYVISGTFGGVQYAWDLNDVEGMQGIRGMQEGIILTENNSYLPEIGITDANPSGVWVGWGIGRSTEFVCYYTKDNKYVVKRPQ